MYLHVYVYVYVYVYIHIYTYTYSYIHICTSKCFVGGVGWNSSSHFRFFTYVFVVLMLIGRFSCAVSQGRKGKLLQHQDASGDRRQASALCFYLID